MPPGFINSLLGQPSSTPLSQICPTPPAAPLIQGRVLKAGLMFVLAGILWILWLGWVVHLWSIVDAALWKPER